MHKGKVGNIVKEIMEAEDTVINDDFFTFSNNEYETLLDETDANTTTLPDRTLKYTSNMIYDYMQRVCADYKYACELINTVPEIHEAFKDCLSYQLMSFIQEGDKSFSADGSMEKSISAKSMQILLGHQLLTIQRPRRLNSLTRSMLWDIQDDWADRGGGVF